MTIEIRAPADDELRAAHGLVAVGALPEVGFGVHHRLAVAFTKPAGDDADDAWVPAVGGHQQACLDRRAVGKRNGDAAGLLVVSGHCRGAQVDAFGFHA